MLRDDYYNSSKKVINRHGFACEQRKFNVFDIEKIQIVKN